MMTAEEVIERLGGAAQAAQRLTLKRTTVAMWRKRDMVPTRHVIAVASALGVPLSAIRPDIYPPEFAWTSAAPAEARAA